MRWLGLFCLLSGLLVTPAGATGEVCLDLPLPRLVHPGDDLRLTAAPAAPPKITVTAPEVQVTAEDELVLLSFVPTRTFSPWLGAGLSLGDTEGRFVPTEVQLGAGLGCSLGDDLRVNLGWRFITNGSDDLGTWLKDAEREDLHRFSFRVEKSF
ncbi:MAG: hypothetical protein IH614_06000 [Desulfuromonadales bacterium]|nr:hypothetical protein [Desulfuromonadales bacterium]